MNVLTAYDPGARLVIGHRGAAARFPENTFASFDHAISLGVDAIEFDLRITRDGVVVVIHDPTLDRTTNASGLVASLTAKDLSAADAGARFSPDGHTVPFAGRGLSIPTLEGLLDRYRDIPLLIELKVPEVAAEVLRLFRRHGCEDRVVVDSIDIRALDTFRGTSVATGAAKRDVLSLMWRGATRLLPASLPYSAVCVPERYKWIKVPVARLVESAGKRGVPTHVWTVNDPGDARRLWDYGVIGIISDDPAAMLQHRRSLGQAAI
jgi:glycerophosphoryl diester phosphodiesterase